MLRVRLVAMWRWAHQTFHWEFLLAVPVVVVAICVYAWSSPDDFAPGTCLAKQRPGVREKWENHAADYRVEQVGEKSFLLRDTRNTTKLLASNKAFAQLIYEPVPCPSVLAEIALWPASPNEYLTRDE